MQDTFESYEVPDISDIRKAYQRISPSIRQTPAINEKALDEVLKCQVWFKCEHLQRTGAFKFRGASNAIALLRESGARGDVATHSSGNHGAALALAAHLDGRTAHVVMPENASPIKIEAVRRYGGEIHFCEATQSAREAGLAELVTAGHIPIPPYDDNAIIIGQGTAALELLQQVSGLELVITPVGGGGLISGTALVASGLGVRTIGAEPAGAADTAASLKQGSRVDSWQSETIADGLRALVGVRNFDIIQNHVEAVLTVTEDEIRNAMSLFWQYFRMLIEPSSAVVLAAVRKHPELFSGRKVGAIVSGANIDPLDWAKLTSEST